MANFSADEYFLDIGYSSLGGKGHSSMVTRNKTCFISWNLILTVTIIQTKRVPSGYKDKNHFDITEVFW